MEKMERDMGKIGIAIRGEQGMTIVEMILGFRRFIITQSFKTINLGENEKEK
jgi:hypothetical protein